MSRRIVVEIARVGCADRSDADLACWRFHRNGRSLIQLLIAVQRLVLRAVSSLILEERTLRLISSQARMYANRKYKGVC
jgi:hypothetical protein